MTTRLFLHTATTTIGGTLPSTEQHTTLTSQDSWSTQSTNRVMDTTIGTVSQAMTRTTALSGSICFITKWISPRLAAQTILANTWTINCAYFQSSLAANWPVSGSNQTLPVNIFIWRPSNGTKVGVIIQGNLTGVNEPPINSNVCFHHTIAGNAITIQTGDVIVYEMWVDNTSTPAHTRKLIIDGAELYLTNGTTNTLNQAGFLETPQDLAFEGDVVTASLVSAKTLVNKFIIKV